MNRCRRTTAPWWTARTVPSSTRRFAVRRAITLDDLERVLRRGEEEPVAALAEPHRAADAASEVKDLRRPLVEPGGRHRPIENLEGLGVVLGVCGDSEHRLGVDRHPRLGTRARMLGKSSSSFRIRPLWTPTTARAAPDGCSRPIDGWPFVKSRTCTRARSLRSARLPARAASTPGVRCLTTTAAPGGSGSA